MRHAETPRMKAVWDSCGDYEKPHKFAARLYEAACAIEQENMKLIEAMKAIELMFSDDVGRSNNRVEMIRQAINREFET